MLGPFASRAITIATSMSIALSGLTPVSAEETTGMGEQEPAQAEVQPQHSPEEAREFLAQELAEEESALIGEYFATAPGSEVEAQALPVVAAAAWCARGALASVPTTALTGLVNGQSSGRRDYAKDAAVRAVFTYHLSIRGPEYFAA